MKKLYVLGIGYITLYPANFNSKILCNIDESHVLVVYILEALNFCLYNITREEKYIKS